MENVNFIELTDPLTEVVTEYAIIHTGENEYISMTKADYDKQLEAAKEQSGTL